MEALVEHAIGMMWERYDEPLTLEAVAAEVFVSPFHFCRVFAGVTGMTPGRYLTAIRLSEAKRLLVTTRHTVSDIVCRVGYSSVGTFTSRFVKRVGMTPTQYRDPPVGGLAVSISPVYVQLPAPGELSGSAAPAVGPGGRSIRARVDLPHGVEPRTVLVGAFEEPFPQRGPVAYRLMAAEAGATEISLDGVPDGHWSVLVAAVSGGGRTAPLVGSVELDVDDATTPAVHLAPAPPRSVAPPLAITLGDPCSGSWAVGRPVPPRARHLRAVA